MVRHDTALDLRLADLGLRFFAIEILESAYDGWRRDLHRSASRSSPPAGVRYAKAMNVRFNTSGGQPEVVKTECSMCRSYAAPVFDVVQHRGRGGVYRQDTS
jgi:hypothetical protein